jgi:hypothetical protein
MSEIGISPHILSWMIFILSLYFSFSPFQNQFTIPEFGNNLEYVLISDGYKKKKKNCDTLELKNLRIPY